MFKKIVFIFLLTVTAQSFAQEDKTITFNDIYSKDGLIYKVSNDSVFSGFIENRRWTNDILLSKNDYKDGHIVLLTQYYNKGKKGIPSRKIYFHEH